MRIMIIEDFHLSKIEVSSLPEAVETHRTKEDKRRNFKQKQILRKEKKGFISSSCKKKEHNRCFSLSCSCSCHSALIK